MEIWASISIPIGWICKCPSGTATYNIQLLDNLGEYHIFDADYVTPVLVESSQPRCMVFHFMMSMTWLLYINFKYYMSHTSGSVVTCIQPRPTSKVFSKIT